MLLIEWEGVTLTGAGAAGAPGATGDACEEQKM